jgi:hypothetical protein
MIFLCIRSLDLIIVYSYSNQRHQTFLIYLTYAHFLHDLYFWCIVVTWSPQIVMSSKRKSILTPHTTTAVATVEPRRAIAQAVSRWLPTAATRLRARVRSCGISGGQSGAGARFLWVLRFPLPIFIPPIAPQSPSPIIWCWYSRPVVAQYQVDSVSPH